MAYTGHGHHIPGTPNTRQPKNPVACGGINHCLRCIKDVREYQEIMVQMDFDHVQKAKDLLRAYIDLGYFGSQEEWNQKPDYKVVVLWTSMVLDNWEVVARTTLLDKKIYKVSYNCATGKIAIDTYVLVRSDVLPKHEAGQ